jgi:hypothetical protein
MKHNKTQRGNEESNSEKPEWFNSVVKGDAGKPGEKAKGGTADQYVDDAHGC